MKEEAKQPDIYKTSKTTWIIFGILLLLLIAIIFMMTRKPKAGEAGAENTGTEAGASVEGGGAPTT